MVKTLRGKRISSGPGTLKVSGWPESVRALAPGEISTVSIGSDCARAMG
ncbi:MAG: hypothetical protein BWY17_02579 [Deltaproteobacteria bacterium ADurb.Bin207]|nr:MAG: hypothetical protein BWY17_02579 [Deltaproteobacteria bacterium ADurb.Bin207]